MRPTRNRNPGWLAGVALLGGLAPASVILVLMHLGTEASGFINADGLGRLLDTDWRPGASLYGILPLVFATLLLAVLAVVISVPVGTLVAVRVALLAGPREQLAAEIALAILAGLPSIIVGLIGLAWLPDDLRFSVAGASLTLTAMILPTYALLAVASLRQLPTEFWVAGRALGLSETTVLTRLALPAIQRDLLGAAALAFGRALGEATAVSLVIGNVTKDVWPGLFGPANTLTTVILKDHGAASGQHYEALFAAALVLATLILTTSLTGMALRRTRSAKPLNQQEA